MNTFLIVVPLLCGGLFLGLLLFMEIGRRIGVRQHTADPDGARAGFGAVDGAVFTLLALIVAFTFSGATSRFDDRRHLVVEEANDIGTAWLRIDLLPAHAQRRCATCSANTWIPVWQRIAKCRISMPRV